MPEQLYHFGSKSYDLLGLLRANAWGTNVTRAKFPRRNADGSFAVVVTLAVEGSSDTLVIELASWLRSDWMTRSQVWNWSGKTGPDLSVKADLTLRYTDEFLGSPEAFTTEGGSIGVRLTGKPSSKFWRDWIASKLLPDIKRKFPMITGVGGIRDDG